MRILITGFMPFGGQSVNPSWEAVRMLSEGTFPAQTRLACLPVEWETCALRLREEIDAFRPDTVLMTGQAGGREGVSIERRAFNQCDCPAADTAGVVRQNQPILEGGPAELDATYPYEAILSSLNAAGIPASFSFDAGRFLCNFALWNALYFAETAYPGMRAGFLHLPYLPGQKEGAPCMKLEEQWRALDTAVRACL